MGIGHDHKATLQRDLEVLAKQTLSRRKAMLLFAGASIVPILGCGTAAQTAADATATTGSTDTSTSTATQGTSTNGTTTGSGSTSTTCTVIPEETAGPYPGDGSNGANALLLSGIVRSTITSSFATASGVAAGVPLKIEITLVNASGSCASLDGYAVYLWHCDKNGNYSMYSTAVKNENYLRGIQASDADGNLSFESIFPGCYDGRWPHIHFEVYPSLAAAANVKNKIATSQIAIPAASAKLAYAASGYSTSVTNFAKANLASDNVFSDGATLQLPTVEGDATNGFTIKLTVAVKA
jgi:protocatechuate 3,4-dioxygenase beta subunit